MRASSSGLSVAPAAAAFSSRWRSDVVLGTTVEMAGAATGGSAGPPGRGKVRCPAWRYGVARTVKIGCVVRGDTELERSGEQAREVKALVPGEEAAP